MTRSSKTRFRFLVAFAILSCGTALAQGVQVKAPRYTPGGEWTVVELDEPSLLPQLKRDWQGSTFWDLRPAAGGGREIRWSVDHPRRVGLDALADSAGADLALCAVDTNDGQAVGCRLIASDRVGPTGPRPLWSSLPGEAAEARRATVQLDSSATLIAGTSFTDRLLDDDEHVAETIEGVALAEGIALTPAGPAEVVLLRETISAMNEAV